MLPSALSSILTAGVCDAFETCRAEFRSDSSVRVVCSLPNLSEKRLSVLGEVAPDFDRLDGLVDDVLCVILPCELVEQIVSQVRAVADDVRLHD